MTKYEWESELKKNLYRLPEREQDKVFEYYNELFFDKAEQGASEQNIIREFGNPFDVANRILADFEDESGARTPSYAAPGPAQCRSTVPKSVPLSPDAGVTVQSPVYLGTPVMGSEPKREIEKEQKGGRSFDIFKSIALFIPLIILGSVVFSLGIALFSVAFSLFVSGGAFIVGGIGGTVLSFFVFSESAAVAGAQIAACVALIGLGIIILPYCYRASVKLAKWTAKTLKAFIVWCTTRRKGK